MGDTLADKIRILYVEEEVSQSQVVKDILQDIYSFQVDVARTYKEAVEAIETAVVPYDAYITDGRFSWGERIEPPKETLAGAQLVRFLRKEKKDTAPITVLSASPNKEIIERELSAEGITDIHYLNKPVSDWREYCRMLKMQITANKKPKPANPGTIIKDSLGTYIKVGDDYLEGT